MDVLKGRRFVKEEGVVLKIVQVAGSLECGDEHPHKWEGEEDRQPAEDGPARRLCRPKFLRAH